MGYLEIILIIVVVGIVGHFIAHYSSNILTKKMKEQTVNVVLQVLLSVSFFISLVAMTGSLYFSEIVYFEPCKLCWYQRIYMYPQVIILMVAMIQKNYKVAFYILPMSLIGSVFALYQYFMQFGLIDITSCGVDAVACGSIYMKVLGFVTIPFLSFVGFVVSGFFVYLAYVINVKQTKHISKEVSNNG